MRITELFGPECWHSARDRLLVIRARCPEFDAHRPLPNQTYFFLFFPHPTNPFCNPFSPILLLELVVSCSLSPVLFPTYGFLSSVVASISSLSFAPTFLSLSLSLFRHTQKTAVVYDGRSHTQTDPSSSPCRKRIVGTNKKKKKRKRRRMKRETSHPGGDDLCQIKLKPAPSSSVACRTFGIWFAAFKVSIVGDQTTKLCSSFISFRFLHRGLFLVHVVADEGSLLEVASSRLCGFLV